MKKSETDQKYEEIDQKYWESPQKYLNNIKGKRIYNMKAVLQLKQINETFSVNGKSEILKYFFYTILKWDT